MTIPITNLISWWSLDETSGSRADKHGTNSLTDNNTVMSAAGKKSNAAWFVKANTEYLSRASNTSLRFGNEDMSLAFWFYLDAVGNSTIIGKDDVGSNREYTVEISTAPQIVFYCFDGTTYKGASDPVTLSLSTWYFSVCWYDSVADTVNLQLNNGTVNSTAHSTGIFSGTSAFMLGGRHNSTSRNLLGGRVDEASLWRRVLSADERTWLYNAGNGRSYEELLGASPVVWFD